MMKATLIKTGILLSVLAIAGLFAASCTKHTAKQAGEGATSGAIIGAVGGLVTGLVFGGNPLDSAAKGAVYGASTGATAGALAGSKQERALKEKQKADEEALKKKIGEDAFNGVVALAQCKHDVALANARIAARDENKQKALAGLWLEALTYADHKEEAKARELFPGIMEKDGKITSVQQAEEKMRQTLDKLMTIREQHGLPKVCP